MAESPIEYFESAAKFRAWLKKHHAKAGEVRVGYIKAGAGRSMTWAESVDEALCFGWIDGVRKRIDAERYFIRFTPRKRTSTWSAVNIRKFAALEAAGRMTEAGRAAFAARSEKKSRTYSFEQTDVKLDSARERLFKGEKKAWAFFMAQPPSYRKKALWWVVSAKKDETKDARLGKVIGASAKGRGWSSREIHSPASALPAWRGRQRLGLSLSACAPVQRIGGGRETITVPRSVFVKEEGQRRHWAMQLNRGISDFPWPL